MSSSSAWFSRNPAHWLLLAAISLLGSACGREEPAAPTAEQSIASPPRCTLPSAAYRPAPDQRALQALLVDHAFELLEAKLAELRRSSDEVYCSDRPFVLAFSALYNGAPSREATLAAWIAAVPSSAYARAARAGHLVNRGEQVRGTRFAADTKQDRFARMGELFERAVEDAVAALELDPSLTPAGAVLLDVGKHQAGAATTSSVHDRLAQGRPDSYILGKGLLDSLAPKWGGSESMLRKAAGRLNAGASNNPDLALLPSLADCLMADHLAVRDREIEAMVAFTLAQRHHAELLDPVCWVYQGRTERRLHRHEDAVASFQRYFDAVGLRVSADSAADSLAQLGRLDEAEALLRSALEVDQGNPELYCDLAGLAFKGNRIAEARELIGQGLALVPDSVGCTRLEARIARTLKLEPSGRIERLQAIAEDSRDSASYHLELGRALVDQRKHVEALAALDRAIALDARNATAYYYRAVAHNAQGNIDQALNDLGHAVDLRPGERTFRSLRGRLRVNHGRDLSLAVEDLEAVVANDGDARDWFMLAGAHYKLRDCAALPALREYARRCRSETCDPAHLEWANRAMAQPEYRTTCPQHY